MQEYIDHILGTQEEEPVADSGGAIAFSRFSCSLTKGQTNYLKQGVSRDTCNKVQDKHYILYILRELLENYSLGRVINKKH